MAQGPCLNESLEGELFTVLQIDGGADEPPRFACRPWRASSREKHTAYGKFTGQISLTSSDEFMSALQDLTTGNTTRVILDFADAQLSKSALGTLVSFAAAMFGRNRRLYVYKVSPHIRKALLDTGLKGFFTYLESEEDIISIFEA